jgi:hypothetical protein
MADEFIKSFSPEDILCFIPHETARTLTEWPKWKQQKKVRTTTDSTKCVCGRSGYPRKDRDRV